VDVGFVGFIEDFLYELRRNEIYALTISDDEVARHDSHVADSNGNIDSSQHDIADGRGINRAEIRRHVDLGNSIEVTHAAVNNQPAAVSGLVHVEEEVVANDGAAYFFPEKIDNQHVAGLQHVDCSLIKKTIAKTL